METLTKTSTLPIVKSTKEYSLFGTLKGNRVIKAPHLRKLISSIKENYMFTVIIVNENMEIIDGQHRAAACEVLNLPIYYVIKEGYTLEDIQRYNVGTTNWSTGDFVDSYCELGRTDYQVLRHFQNKYKFGYGICALLMNGGNEGGKGLAVIATGNFKVRGDINKANDLSGMIIDFEKYFPSCRQTTFIRACLGIFKSENYDHKLMMERLRTNPDSLKVQPNRQEYERNIEDVYNYRSREKVRLF